MLTVITGPPCSGKSTYAREHARPGDIVIDYDLIAQALGSPDSHDHPYAIRRTAIIARRAAIGAAIEAHHTGTTVWIIDSDPPRSRLHTYRQAGAQFVNLTADPAELHRRADAERPARWHELIDRQLAGTRASRHLATERDYRRGRTGRPWRRIRTAVLAASDVCWVCGHGGARAVDHVVPLSSGGPPLDPGNLRPIHGNEECPDCKVNCNAVKGDRVNMTQRERRSRAW